MESKTIKVREDRHAMTARTVDNQSNVIVLLPAAFDDFDHLPYGALLMQRLRRAAHDLTSADPFVTELPNAAGTRVALTGLRDGIGAFELLTLARKLFAAHTPRPGKLAVGCFGLSPRAAEAACEALVAATAAACFELPSYKSKQDKPKPLTELHLFGHQAAHGYARTLAEARGNNLARYLTALPPNELTPGAYRRRVEKLAREQGWKCRFHDLAKLRKLGAGAFLAVAQGSPEPDAGILHLRYAPKKTAAKLVSLVGKGICFDTGGTNLKSARHMHGMHEDMEGSAVALGTLLALTELKASFTVDCWLALAQNHIGPRAYKQNDVVRAANGTTIEVVHTDAEGRMILADTLHLASREKPRLLVDYATLTGACVGALSTRMSGALTNRASLLPTLIRAGETSGERVWPFPLPEDFNEALKSTVADVKQCTLDSEADHILAAAFLKKFLANDPDWVHVDLSAGNHKGGLAHIPTDITGFGVRFTLNLLLDQGVLA
jgi:leucyl aminopeptidase